MQETLNTFTKIVRQLDPQKRESLSGDIANVTAALNGDSKNAQALNALLAGLEDLGFGTDDEIEGTDTVAAISELYVDVTQRILGATPRLPSVELPSD